MDYQKIAVCLIGNATKDAAVKTAKESGNAYADFTVAVRDRQKETHYFPIRCFGKLAESVTGIKKGTKMFVEGDLELGSFSEDGKKQMTFRVLANAYRILGNGHRTEADKMLAVSEPVQVNGEARAKHDH